MSLNRILAYEQLILMRYALESDIDMVIIHRHKLSLIAQLLTSYPYPHRPYSRRSFNAGESTPILPATSRALLALLIHERWSLAFGPGALGRAA
jgi:hypothetical protein